MKVPDVLSEAVRERAIPSRRATAAAATSTSKRISVWSQTKPTGATSTRAGVGAEAYYLHIAERVGPAAYISRAMFLTNKYLNLTARTVRAFDPDDPDASDYRPGRSALLAWGRPAFDDETVGGAGEAPPYFLYHPLPFELSGDRIAFAPRYLTGIAGGQPIPGLSGVALGSGLTAVGAA